mmetsp:Transcript_151871/g.485407  ORF Transcript_151871/g.485407 Transcript_151871/m.485407 type:complete len:330 (+) Transcript_151871:319-1308(+)
MESARLGKNINKSPSSSISEMYPRVPLSMTMCNPSSMVESSCATRMRLPTHGEPSGAHDPGRGLARAAAGSSEKKPRQPPWCSAAARERSTRLRQADAGEGGAGDAESRIDAEHDAAVDGETGAVHALLGAEDEVGARPFRDSQSNLRGSSTRFARPPANGPSSAGGMPCPKPDARAKATTSATLPTTARTCGEPVVGDEQGGPIASQASAGTSPHKPIGGCGEGNDERAEAHRAHGSEGGSASRTTPVTARTQAPEDDCEEREVLLADADAQGSCTKTGSVCGGTGGATAGEDEAAPAPASVPKVSAICTKTSTKSRTSLRACCKAPR